MHLMKALYKISFTLLMLFTMTAVGLAQNLVPNPSFEDTVYCPTSFNQLNATLFWYSPNNGSSDYFNSCNNQTSTVGVPQNDFGYQYAKTGNAYAGWGNYHSLNSNAREYLQIQLTSALISGKKYFVSAYLSKSDSMPVAIKDIGIALSDSAIGNLTGTTIYYTPQIIYSSFLTNTDWVELYDTIIANGGEKYLTIGYFKDDNSSDTINLFNSQSYNYQSYYYVDDVNVNCLNCSTGIDDISSLDKINIYPNPSSDFINVFWGALIVSKLTLFNSMGQIVLTVDKKNLQNKNSLTIKLNSFNKGAYFLKIENEKFSTVNKIFLINN